ncbi:MAG: SBBP repeat-containing protein [Thermodesulfobacteriota bacterium]
MLRGRRFPRSPRISWVLLTPLIAAIISVAAIRAVAEAGQTPDRLECPGPARFGLAPAETAEFSSRLPLFFMKNQGQLKGPIKYYEQARGRAVYFTPAGLKFTFLKEAEPVGEPGRRPRKGKALRAARLSRQPATPLRFTLNPVGMSRRVQIVGADPRPGKVNYLRGPDPEKWRTGIPTYGAVAYLGAYPGIDLKFYGTGRHLEYDVIVHPGAAPSRVRFQYQGIKGLEVTPDGDLAVHLPDGGSLVQKKPLIYQVIDGVRVPRQGGFKLAPGKDVRGYSFEVASYDKKIPLVIDPEMLYSTYLGGSAYDAGYAVAVDSSGNAYLTGCTFSDDFPAAGGYDSYLSGYEDVFVAKFNAAGAMVYSTYLGGYGTDEGYGIAVDGSGSAYVTGYTDSSSFPTRNAWQSSRKGSTDAFLTKLNAAGNALVYSTYLGDNYDDAGYGMAVDIAGNAYVAGESFNPGSLYNAFVARFNSSGSQVYRTSLGGAGDDYALGIAADKNGNAYVTGGTRSTNFPVTAGVLQTQFKGGSDAFVAKLNSAGSVVYSTYLGGSLEDEGYGLAVDNYGNPCVAGTTYSIDFPLKSPYQSSRKGNADAFVARLNTTGTALNYSTYLGQDNDDEGFGLALDRSGAAYIAGWTASPVPDSPGIYHADAYVAKLLPSGNKLGYFFLLGGSDDDWGNGIAVDNRGNVYVTGETWSKDFPTKTPQQAALKGDADGFVVKIKGTMSNISGVLMLLMQ